MSSWSRPSTVSAVQPLTVKRVAMPPGQPCVADWLSITIAVRLARPVAPAYAIASWLDPSSSSASPSRTYTRGLVRPWARRPSAVPTASARPCPSEPEPISTPGTSSRSGWWPSRLSGPAEVVEPGRRDEALGREYRVVGGRAVALGQQEPVAVGVVRVARVDPQDPVVEHPEHVERGVRGSAACFSSPVSRCSAVRNPAGSVVVAVVMSLGCNLKSTSTQGAVMQNPLTIGELAARSGVAPSALRYYERLGLIHSIRTGGNQRRYERAELRRVAFVRDPRRSGCRWTEIGRALDRYPPGVRRPRPTGRGCPAPGGPGSTSRSR